MKRFFLFVIVLLSGTAVWSADAPSPADDFLFEESSISSSSSDDDYNREVDKMLKPGPFECRGCYRKNKMIGELRAGLGNQQIRYESRVGRLTTRHQKELGEVRNAARKEAKDEYTTALAEQEERLRLMAKQTGEGVRAAITKRYRLQRKALEKKHEKKLVELREELKASEAALFATVMRITQGQDEEEEFEGHAHERFLCNIQSTMRRQGYKMSMLAGTLKRVQQQEAESQEEIAQQRSEIKMLRAFRPALNINSGILALFCSGRGVGSSAFADNSGAAGGVSEPMSDDSDSSEEFEDSGVD